MTLTRLTAPAALPVTLAEAKAHLRVDSADEDALITTYLAAAVAELDGDAGLLSRALITQRWRYEFPLRGHRLAATTGFPLPLPPCQAVESVTHTDGAGVDWLLAPEAVTVTGLGGHDKARVSLAPTGSWAGTSLGTVAVVFRAGYGDAPEDVPAPIRSAILEAVANRYAFRESSALGAAFSSYPQSAIRALDNYRQWAL